MRRSGALTHRRRLAQATNLARATNSLRTALTRRDWLALLAWMGLGIAGGYLLLWFSIRVFLEPLMVSESSMRIAKNVLLVEEVLKQVSIKDLPSGMIIREDPIQATAARRGLSRFDQLLQESLIKDRGLNRTILPDSAPLIDPLGGHWVRLNASSNQPALWLYQADRLSSSLWFMAPLRAFTLALGMLAGIVLYLRQHLIKPIASITASLPDGSNHRTKLIAEEGMTPVRSLCVNVNRLLERINANEDERRSFIRGLVHDLSSPTTRLGLKLEQLELDDQGRHQALLASMNNDLEQLSSLVDQLRRIASDESLKGVQQEAALDDLCKRISDRYHKDDIAIKVPRILVRLDVAGLERAICNLLDNALEYGKPPVRIQAKRTRHSLLISVDDRGQGIASPTLLTMPHQSRSNDRQRVRHQGLGLQIVEAFCAQHNGEMKLSDSAQGGLRVQLVLPASVLVP